LIITCRIATSITSLRDSLILIIDFDSSQIEAFKSKWFVAVGRNSREKGLAKAAQFMQKRRIDEFELARTPLRCIWLVLCFKKSNFPAKQTDFYKQGLDILLVRWDEARGIKRDEIYRYLSFLKSLNC